MGKYALRHALAKSHKHCRPNNTVKTNDVFAYYVHLSRPETRAQGGRLRRIIAIPNRGIVVEQRIKPHVGNMTFIKGNGNSPVKACTRNGYVLKSRLHKRTDLIETKIRLYELGMFFVQFKEAILKLGKLKEPRLFRYTLKRTMAVGA